MSLFGPQRRRPDAAACPDLVKADAASSALPHGKGRISLVRTSNVNKRLIGFLDQIDNSWSISGGWALPTPWPCGVGAGPAINPILALKN
jgi:hypothetical protein